MRQINIKNTAAADLLDQVVAATGQRRTDAVIRALELYLKSLDASKGAEAAIALVCEQLHPAIAPEHLGKMPSRSEQQELLGMYVVTDLEVVRLPREG